MSNFLIFMHIFTFLLTNWRVVAIISCVLLILILLFNAGSCLSNWRTKRELNKVNRQIEQTEIKIERTEKIRKETAINANISQQIANNAAANFNRVINTDSTERESNFRAVREKWCSQPEHANDSLCRK